MIIKILSRSRAKNKWLPGPQVCLPKIDVAAYRATLSTSKSASSSSCVKEEVTPCFFNSEVDLDNNRNEAYVEERSLACNCGYCSPLYELKDRMREEFLLQQRVNSPIVSSPPVHEFPYIPEEERLLPPQPVFATNSGTQTENKIYRFTCKDCNSEFNDEYFFDHHRKVHIKMFECAFCEAQFVNAKLLETHLFLHLQPSVYECIYCQAIYRKKKFLNEHLMIHEKYMFNCATCSAKFDTKQDLDKHQKFHASSGSLVHVFRKLTADQMPANDDATVEVAAVAIQTKTPKVRNDFYECEKCSMKFEVKGKWEKHTKIHSRNASGYFFHCKKCDAKFKHNGGLLSHFRAAHKGS